MSLDRNQPRGAKAKSPRPRVVPVLSWLALGVAVAAAGCLLLWLQRDVDSKSESTVRSSGASMTELQEARHGDVSRLGAVPRLNIEADAGAAPEGPGQTRGWPDAGAASDIIFPEPVVVPPGEAPASAEDTGLVFGPQADPRFQPGREDKSDEPDVASRSGTASLEMSPQAVVVLPTELPNPLREKTTIEAEDITEPEDIPVERFSDTGLIFRNAPSDGK